MKLQRLAFLDSHPSNADPHPHGIHMDPFPWAMTAMPQAGDQRHRQCRPADPGAGLYAQPQRHAGRPAGGLRRAGSRPPPRRGCQHRPSRRWRQPLSCGERPSTRRLPDALSAASRAAIRCLPESRAVRGHPLRRVAAIEPAVTCRQPPGHPARRARCRRRRGALADPRPRLRWPPADRQSLRPGDRAAGPARRPPRPDRGRGRPRRPAARRR